MSVRSGASDRVAASFQLFLSPLFTKTSGWCWFFFFPSHYPGALKAGVMCQGWIWWSCTFIGLLVTNSTPLLHTFAPFTRPNPQIPVPLSKMNTHCSFSVHYRVTISPANKCFHSQGNGSAGGMMWSHQSNMSCIQLNIVKMFVS